MPNTPYNTGKVKIGLAYEPPRQSHVTPEGEQTQRLLLGIERAEARQNLGLAVYVALLFILSIGAIALVG